MTARAKPAVDGLPRGRAAQAHAGSAVKHLARRLRNALRRTAFAALTPGLRLDPAELVANRSVLVIGPAAGVAGELAELDPDGFDVIIRMNRGLLLAADPANGVGTRTDILFHNLKEAGPRSAGRLSGALLDAGGVRHVVFPHALPGQLHAIRRARHRLRSLACRADLRLVPPRLSERLSRELAPWLPTTGTVAIAFAAEGRPRRLAIVGFSFFRTGYQPGYAPAANAGSDPAAWAAGDGAHDPLRDRDVLRTLLAELADSGVEVVLGREVRKHLGATGPAVGTSR